MKSVTTESPTYQMHLKVISQFQSLMAPHGVKVEQAEKPEWTGFHCMTLSRGPVNIIIKFSQDGTDTRHSRPFHLDYETHYMHSLKVRGFLEPEVTVTPEMVEKFLDAIKRDEAHHAQREMHASMLIEVASVLKASGLEFDGCYKDSYKDSAFTAYPDGSCTVTYDKWVNGKTLKDFTTVIARLADSFGEATICKATYKPDSVHISLRFPRGDVNRAKVAADMIGDVFYTPKAV